MTQQALQCVDLPALLEDVQSLAIEDRSLAMMQALGCTSWPGHPRIIQGPSARLASIGGISVFALSKAGLNAESIARLTQQHAGACASMAYLTLPGGTCTTAYHKIVEGLGHHSCLHTVYASVVLAGMSTAAENELNSQRDLVHLSRLTESRTKAQNRPVLSCLDSGMVTFAQQLLDSFDGLRAQALQHSTLPPKDALETANNLAPSMRAGVLVVSASLRNFQKLFDAIDDDGKEMESRQALVHVRAQLAQVWPTLFSKDPWSQHFAKPQVFEGWMDTLCLDGLEAVEVGAGKGALTRALLAAGVQSIDAWEIDPNIVPLDDPRVHWHVKDFTQDHEWVAMEGRLLAAFPPYVLLPELMKLSERAKCTLLMVPGRALPEMSAQGFQVLACLPGDAFEPISKGAHFIVSKGIGLRT